MSYPKAALFGFSLALVAYCIFAVIQAALRSRFGDQIVANEVSFYYLALELSTTNNGLEVAIPEEVWHDFHKMNDNEFVYQLMAWCQNFNLKKYPKQKTRTRARPEKRIHHSEKPHISNARILAERKKKKK